MAKIALGVNQLDLKLKNLDLVDMLSERHLQLRNITEKLWNDSNDIYLSNSEWFILARIYENEPTIAYVCKHVNISRQATHKVIRNLEAKGLLEINNVENNKKEKRIRLTTLGNECYKKNELMKANLENEIANNIGAEQLKNLKDFLKLDWGL